MTQLSAHFSLAELLHSDTALAQGLDNTPDTAALANLERLATTLLEPIRAALFVPIVVSDAYRSPAVNKAAGGVPNSQHERGEAADLVPRGMALRDAFDDIRTNAALPYDQCIYETSSSGGTGCIHVSIAALGATPRREALIRTGTAPHWSYEAP